MTISFNNIPINLQVPGQYVEFDNSKAIVGLPLMPSKILVLGQRLAAGTVLAGVPTQIFSSDQAVQAFGQGSMIANMFKALKAVNPLTETWAIAQDDNGAAAAATGTVTIGGAAVAASTYPLYVAGRLVQIPVTPAQTPAQIATALAAAVNADLDGWVTAAAALAVVTLTARNKGLCGNDIDIRNTFYSTDAVPVGLTSVIVAMSGGTANPVLTGAIAGAGDEWFTDWANPYTDGASLTAVAAELLRRFGPTVMREGLAYHGSSGSVGTLASFGTAQNSQLLTTMGMQKSPMHPAIWAAVSAAQAAYYGNIDPARPLQTLPLSGILAPAIPDRFIWSDRNLLLQDGISTFTVDPSGVVAIERMVTMYRLNSFNLPDASYHDVETLKTLFFIRYSMRSRVAQKFPRFKLAGDDSVFGAGQAIVRPKDIRIELIALASQWQDAGLIEDITQFKRDLLVERDGTDVNRVNALVPPNLVNQFRIFAGKVQFIL